MHRIKKGTILFDKLLLYALSLVLNFMMFLYDFTRLDSSFVVSGSQDTTLKIWNVPSEFIEEVQYFYSVMIRKATALFTCFWNLWLAAFLFYTEVILSEVLGSFLVDINT